MISYTSNDSEEIMGDGSKNLILMLKRLTDC